MWAVDKRKGDSSAPTMEDLLGYFNGGEMPECPAGGEYDLKTVAEYPSCSEHGCYKEEEACPYCGNHFPASNIRFHVRKCPKNNTTQKMPPASGKTTILK